MLLCPKCKKPLQKEIRCYRCENKHTYDISKQGYTNLYLTNKKQTGDDATMVKARTAFLEKGYYEPLRTLLVDLCKQRTIHLLVDAGCGEGYYTNELQKQINCETYGFDLSKHALKEASKTNKNVCYGVCSVFDLPLKHEVADVVLSVFAPVADQEIRRILKKDGWFIKVEPKEEHLYEMKQVVYEQAYLNDAKPSEYEGFVLEERIPLSYQIHIKNKEDLKALFAMTPYYYRSPKDGVKKLFEQEEMEITAAFYINKYKKIDG